MKVVIVDDEKMAAEQLYDICMSNRLIDEAIIFNNPSEAWAYLVKHDDVAIAFLDIEMPVMSGIELAKRLKAINSSARIVFVTGFKEYAYDAFGVNAIGYVLKPYDDEAVFDEIEKAAALSGAVATKEIFIKTFGSFDVFVNKKAVHFSSAKSKEFLALLVDRRGSSVSSEQAIATLWPDREYDEASQALFRKVLKSLRTALAEAGISDIFIDGRNQRSVDTTKFRSDLYDFLNDPRGNVSTFQGEYMEGYAFGRQTANQIRNQYYEIKGGF
ncbi:MAG: response regulator [Clostridiales bacterium]|nr:response regulator [Clostridiales bacterium]